MTIDKERLRVLARDCISHPLSRGISDIEEAGEGISALLSENAALEKRERHALMAADAEAKLFDEERQKNAALAAEVERLRADHAAALGLVADVRFALGDNGKRMQPELIEWIKQRRNAGTQLANLAYNWSQREGHDLTGDDCELLHSLCQQWDAAMADKGAPT